MFSSDKRSTNPYIIWVIELVYNLLIFIKDGVLLNGILMYIRSRRVISHKTVLRLFHCRINPL